MKFLIQLLLISGFLPLRLLSQDAIEVTGAKVTEVGIYSAQIVTNQISTAGVKLQGLDEFKLVSNTTNIPARVGTRFGFRYEIVGSPTNAPIVLTMVAIHPPIKNAANGTMEMTNVYQLRSWIGKTYTSASLDEQTDCMPGQWRFEVWHQQIKLCEQSFLVVPVKSLP